MFQRSLLPCYLQGPRSPIPFLDVFYPEDKGDKLLQKIRNCSPITWCPISKDSSNINTFQQYHRVQHLFWQQQHLWLHDDPVLSHNVLFPVCCVSPSYIPALPITLILWSSKSVMWNLKFNQSVLLSILVYLPWKTQVGTRLTLSVSCNMSAKAERAISWW